MSLLRRLERRAWVPSPSYIPTWTYPQNAPLLGSLAGEIITVDSAMRHSAVWRCVNILADIAADVDYVTLRDRADGSAERQPAPAILTNPDPSDPSINAKAWRRQVMVSWLLRGNAYGTVLASDPAGRPTAVQIQHPDLVTVTRVGALGPLEFRLNGQEIERWPNGPLWHVPAFTVPGSSIGISPIEYARQAIGLGLAIERFGAQWFGDGAHPSGVLSSDQVLTDQQAKQAKQRFVNAIRGTREPAVLGAGLDFKGIQIAPEESQFLESMQANIATVARFYGVPPEMIGGTSASSMTYASLEQRSLDFLTFAAQTWITKFEDIYTASTTRPLRVAADLDTIVRLDATTRVKLQEQRIRMGTRSPNETRREDHLPPIADGGDEYLWPPYAVRFDPTDPAMDPTKDGTP